MPATLTPNSIRLLEQRYLDTPPGGQRETIDGMFWRISGGNEQYHDLFTSLDFLPNSPAIFNYGTGRRGTVFACFVFYIADNLLDTPDGILPTRNKAAAAAKFGGGVGYYLGNIRKKGALIQSVQRKACGPCAVVRDLNALCPLITQGGKRDLAQLATLPSWHEDALEYVHLKADPELASKLSGFNLSLSWQDSHLNSALLNPGSTAAGLFNVQCAKAWATGCPGILFEDTANINCETPWIGRLLSPNPCQPGFATVLTPEGIRTFDDISAGSIIWSGQRWTRVVRKVATGIKPVFRYETTAGIFVGTSDHQVFSGGERIKIGDADSIDACFGPSPPIPAIDSYRTHRCQDVVDGWVLGDGMVHKASGNLVLLCLGRDDGVFHDLFGQQSADLVIRHRPGIKDTAWEVRTTITASELPRTWDRRVPNRFLHAPAHTVCAFLCGLYSANGSVTGGRITLKTTSDGLARDVQQMLSSVGIPSYITTNAPSSIIWKNGTFTSKVSYDVNITTGRDDFMKQIGFCHIHKSVAARDVIESRKKNHRPKRTFEVTRTLPLGEMPVYDITVEDQQHSYWTGGLLVSNCGESWLYSDEPCDLGSMNLVNFVTPNRTIDFTRLYERARIAQRYLDHLHDVNEICVPEVMAAARRTRKTGLGEMGWADALCLLHIHYDSPQALELADQVSACISEAANDESLLLAKKHGPYPGYDEIKAVAPPYRNATRTCIAPTGSIYLLAGLDSASIEPHYMLESERKTYDGMILQEKVGAVAASGGFVPRTAYEIGWRDHIKMQAAFQRHVDLAVSKTINMPNNATVEDVKDAYLMMWREGCKGGTIYRQDCRDEAVLVERGRHQEGAGYSVKASSNGVALPAEPKRKKLPKTTQAIRHKFHIGDFECYLIVGLYADGTPGEIFIEAPRVGSTISGLLNVWAMACSLALQYGCPVSQLAKLYHGSVFEPHGITNDDEIKTTTSIADYVFRWMESHYCADDMLPGHSGMFCADCQAEAIHQGGCLVCSRKCGWTRC